MSTCAPRRPDDHQVRHHIDQSVGRALVDQSFAARLLNEPVLALEGAACGSAQYLAVREIRAQEIGDFARQIFDLFWAPAQVDQGDGVQVSANPIAQMHT